MTLTKAQIVEAITEQTGYRLGTQGIPEDTPWVRLVACRPP